MTFVPQITLPLTSFDKNTSNLSALLHATLTNSIINNSIDPNSDSDSESDLSDSKE